MAIVSERKSLRTSTSSRSSCLVEIHLTCTRLLRNQAIFISSMNTKWLKFIIMVLTTTQWAGYDICSEHQCLVQWESSKNLPLLWEKCVNYFFVEKETICCWPSIYCIKLSYWLQDFIVRGHMTTMWPLLITNQSWESDRYGRLKFSELDLETGLSGTIVGYCLLQLP